MRVVHGPSQCCAEEVRVTAALATVDSGDVGITPAFALSEAKVQMDALTRFVAEQLVEDEDYGRIPGTPKPSLYQPGAQKLAFFYGLTPEPHLEREIVTEGFLSKTYRVDLISRQSGRVVAGCAGSCNSTESRFYKKEYQGREWTGNYLCMWRDARETENTCDKMAQKRALVGAVLIALRATGLFTQDVEDLPREQVSQQERPVESNEPITADTKVTFGKAKGTAIKDLPDSYLHWATDGQQKHFGSRTDEWVGAFEAEIERRSNAT